MNTPKKSMTPEMYEAWNAARAAYMAEAGFNTGFYIEAIKVIDKGEERMELMADLIRKLPDNEWINQYDYSVDLTKKLMKYFDTMMEEFPSPLPTLDEIMKVQGFNKPSILNLWKNYDGYSSEVNKEEIELARIKNFAKQVRELLPLAEKINAFGSSFKIELDGFTDNLKERLREIFDNDKSKIADRDSIDAKAVNTAGEDARLKLAVVARNLSNKILELSAIAADRAVYGRKRKIAIRPFGLPLNGKRSPVKQGRKCGPGYIHGKALVEREMAFNASFSR